MKSKEFEDKQDILEKISKDSQLRKQQRINAVDAARTASVHLERHANLDNIEVNAKREEKMNYLKLALKHYAKGQNEYFFLKKQFGLYTC